MVSVDPVVVVLRRLQDHWLEQAVLPSLAVGFAMAAMILARNFANFFAETAYVPGWILLLGVPVVILGVFSGRLLSRAQAPVLAHIVGGVLILLVTYTLLRMVGTGASHRQLAILLPLAVLLLGWYLAMSAGMRFARIGSITRGLEEQTAEEREQIIQSTISPMGLAEHREAVVAFFTRRTLTYVVFAAILAAGAFDQPHVWDPRWMTWRWSVALSMAALLSCGLILQGCVFIYVLRSAWSESNTKVSPTFVENWVKNTLVMVGVAVGAAFLAPARFALFDFTTTMNAATQWVAWFLSQGVTLFNRHALQQRGTPSAPGAPPPGILGNPGPVEHAATAFMVLLALVAAVAVLILVVAVIVVFLRGEWRKRPGLLRALKLSIFSLGDLVAYTRTFFRALVSWLIHLLNWRNEDRAQTGRRRRPRGRRRNSKDDSVVDERLPGEYMRRLFVRFLRAAKEQGLRPRSDHTAYEFAGVVKAEVEGVDEDVELLAQRYLEARYGRRQVERSESLEQAWTRVAHGLRNRRNMRHRQDSHRG